MAIPERVPSISVPDTVMYNDTDKTVTWTAAEGANSYELYVKGSNENSFTLIYSGTALSYTLGISKYPDYSTMVFRVYSVNDDGKSLYPRESKTVSIIDISIEEDVGGTMILQPFGLIINAQSSKFDDVPSVRETSETITGLDGEIPVDVKYSPRLFDLVCFMKSEFESVSDRENYIRNMSRHINRSVRNLRNLLFRGKIYRVKRISSEFERRPTFCNLDISYKAYDVFGYSVAENVLYGDGTCLNSGEENCYPIIILEGEQNNPTITVNGNEYQTALDTSAGDTVIIDCEKETVLLEKANGEKSYLAGAYYLEFPIFKVGNNTVSGCTAVKWRNKYFTL